MKENVIIIANEDEKNLQYKKRKEKFWVFFDHFNTSTCMGLITEIICVIYFIFG